MVLVLWYWLSGSVSGSDYSFGSHSLVLDSCSSPGSISDYLILGPVLVVLPVLLLVIWFWF